MSVLLLGVWRFIRPLMPYIAAALAIVALAFLLWRAPWAESRQKAADYAHFQPKLERALSNIHTLKANQAVLLAAIARQNAAVEALKAAGDKRASDGKAALVAARRANQGLSEQADALRKSAGRKLDGAPCPVSDTLAKVGSI